MRLSALFILLMMIFVSGNLYSQIVPIETTPTPQVREIQTIVNELFAPLVKKDTEGFLKKLFAVFPIGDRARLSFSEDIKTLTSKLNFPLDFEFVGYRSSGKSERFLLVYYLSIHPDMPVGWEFTFYRPVADGPWQMNFLRYHSDELFEFLHYPKMPFEVMQRQLREGQPQMAPPTITDVNEFNKGSTPAPTTPEQPATPEQSASPAPATASDSSPAGK